MKEFGKLGFKKIKYTLIYLRLLLMTMSKLVLIIQNGVLLKICLDRYKII